MPETPPVPDFEPPTGRVHAPPVGRACRAAAIAVIAALLLAACASTPPTPDRDGPPLTIPAGLERTPDAVPRVEPIRSGGPNKPYEAAGRSYTPVTTDQVMTERGGASWYGRKYHGKPTSSGETYDMFAMTAAHPTMPIPSYARVRNPANGRAVIVRVNDRGPFVPGRVIDLSYTAALKLGLLAGVAPVEVERITHAEIRARDALSL
jgi:rare lipoprotein A